jgi:hypothetical protein
MYDMDDTSFDFVPEETWLTRSESARYVGVSGESTIRAAEAKGLRGIADPSGQVWHTPEALDAWPWRVKPPPPAQKARVLRDARKARQQEARARDRKEEQEARRAQAESDAQLTRQRAGWDAEDAFKAKVAQKGKDMRAAFELAHMNARTAGEALGFKSHEASWRLRDLVKAGLLRQIESPLEPDTMTTFDGVREVEGPTPLCWGGPFFLREDVLALRREALAVARETLINAPASVRQEARETPTADILAELLRALIDKSR